MVGWRCEEEPTSTAFPRGDVNCGLAALINHSTISLTYKELLKINKTRPTTNFEKVKEYEQGLQKRKLKVFLGI